MGTGPPPKMPGQGRIPTSTSQGGRSPQPQPSAPEHPSFLQDWVTGPQSGKARRARGPWDASDPFPPNRWGDEAPPDPDLPKVTQHERNGCLSRPRGGALASPTSPLGLGRERGGVTQTPLRGTSRKAASALGRVR